METHKMIDVTLDEARELYNSHNKTLKELALKCFPENELSENYFTKIKSFEDAVNALGMILMRQIQLFASLKRKASLLPLCSS